MLENYDHVIIIKNIDNIIKKLNLPSLKQYEEQLEITFKTYMRNRLIKVETFQKNDNLYIGLLLKQDRLNNRLEKGPVYGSEEAVKFKELWGDKSVMMRIDGDINECIMWPKEGNLLLKIVDFIMKEKLNYAAHGTKGGWHQIYSAQINRFIKPLVLKDSVKELSNIKSAFTVLSELLSVSTASKSVKALPVSIHDIRSVGAWAKLTNVFPEKCISIAGFSRYSSIDQLNTVYHVSLNVETNNKWLADKDAFDLMRTLFTVKMSKAIFADRKIYSKVIANGDIDIHIKGFIFRCSLVINKELVNLSRLHSDFEFREVGKKRNRNNKNKKILEEMRPLLKINKSIREWIFKHRLIPNINNQIRVFSAQFGKIYSDTCRLVKRWMCSNFITILDDGDNRMTELYLNVDENQQNRLYGYCFTEISIELIIASLFLNPAKEYSARPQSSLCGLMRFLKFFSEFDWLRKPLVVNVKDEFSEKEVTEFGKEFRDVKGVNRHTELSAMVIRLPSNLNGDHWTCQGPNNDTLEFVKKLCKEAFVSLTYLLENDRDIKPLFTVERSRFDVLFHLKYSVIDLMVDKCIDCTEPEVRIVRKEKLKKAEKKENFRMWPRDYEDSPIDSLVNYINDFVETGAVCSYDKCGGRFIALRWLKTDIDKKWIIKSICDKGKSFISKCEIIE